ncbi:MAG: DoxX family protein [Akkermansiaceae bacterium]
MKPAYILSWILQLCIIGLIAPAAYFKLTSHPESVALFSLLEMEPTGRYIIGFLEATACALLLTPNSAVHGAILSLGLMLGAVIAHATKIGLNDIFAYFSITLVILSSTVIFIRRKQIKSIARMLD